MFKNYNINTIKLFYSINMIIKNSFQMRVFNGKGCEHEVLLLLKLFNKYNGMYNILKMVKTLKVVSFDTNEIIKKIYINSRNLMKQTKSFRTNENFCKINIFFLWILTDKIFSKQPLQKLQFGMLV